MVKLFRDYGQKLLAEAGVTLDGSAPEDVQVHNERVYSRVFWGGMRSLGNSYVDGDWDCKALDQFFEKTSQADIQPKLGRWVEFVLLIREKVFNIQSVRRALEVGRRHYDLGNDLYREMLGPTMAYSCGRYADGAQTLDEAQRAKFDRICRLLELKPGMRVLEIGCGWGTFARHAATHYGVSVEGISISTEQLAYAREQAESLPIQFHFLDYRALPSEWLGSFDAAVSIEMIEAVGAKNMQPYMRSAHSALKPGGRFLVQAIIGDGLPDAWISKYIFPNGVLPSATQIAQAAHRLFDIRLWDSFGPDYDRTLGEWCKRFEASWPVVQKLQGPDGKPLYDQRFYRMWRYYLLMCQGIFRSRHIDVAHILLARRG